MILDTAFKINLNTLYIFIWLILLASDEDVEVEINKELLKATLTWSICASL